MCRFVAPSLDLACSPLLTGRKAPSPPISCSTRARGARGGTSMSTLILAGLLPVTSSGGRAAALKTTGTMCAPMVQVWSGAPTTTARTADAIGAISIDDDKRRPPASRTSHLFDILAWSRYVRYQQMGLLPHPKKFQTDKVDFC